MPVASLPLERLEIPSLKNLDTPFPIYRYTCQFLLSFLFRISHLAEVIPCRTRSGVISSSGTPIFSRKKMSQEASLSYCSEVIFLSISQFIFIREAVPQSGSKPLEWIFGLSSLGLLANAFETMVCTVSVQNPVIAIRV